MSLVSVIVPFLDPNEDFFRQAIASVQAQTLKDWELILVDDGSGKQATESALRLVESSLGKVKYFEHEDHRNRGTSASRNLGLSKASGRYVAFIDADDIWTQSKLEQQIEILEANSDASMVFGNSLYWYGWTGLPRDDARDYVPSLGNDDLQLVNPPRYLTLALRDRVIVPCPSSVVARLDAVRACGGFEDSFTGSYDDQVFYAKLWLRHPIYAASRCWDKYRQHPNSLCAQLNEAKAEEARLMYLTWLIEYLREQSYEGTGVWRAALVERHLCTSGGVGLTYRRARRFVRRTFARTPHRGTEGPGS
jgi:glycosyltransferase involved in cell wall biosynthesis